MNFKFLFVIFLLHFSLVFVSDCHRDSLHALVDDFDKNTAIHAQISKIAQSMQEKVAKQEILYKEIIYNCYEKLLEKNASFDKNAFLALQSQLNIAFYLNQQKVDAFLGENQIIFSPDDKDIQEKLEYMNQIYCHTTKECCYCLKVHRSHCYCLLLDDLCRNLCSCFYCSVDVIPSQRDARISKDLLKKALEERLIHLNTQNHIHNPVDSSVPFDGMALEIDRK